MEEEEFASLLASLSVINSDDKTLAVVKSISEVFMKDLTQLHCRLYIAQVLDEESVLQFIKLSPSSHGKTVIALFELIEYLITNFQETAPFVKAVSSMCVVILRVHNPAKIKEEACKCLKALVEHSDGLDVEVVLQGLKMYLGEESKVPMSVFQQLGEVVGLILEKHPQEAKGMSEWFLHKFLDLLHHELNIAKERRFSYVIGCLVGLDGYLANFKLEDSKKLYDVLKVFCRYEGNEEGRRVVNRAALRCFSRHARLFESFIYQDRDFWQCSLTAWTRHRYSEDRKAGMAAVLSLYRTLARYLRTAHLEDGPVVLRNYLSRFKVQICSRDPYEFKCALLGVGELTTAAAVHPELQPETDAILHLITLQSHALYGDSYLGLYIQSISKLISKPEDFECLCRLSVQLFVSFPRTEALFHKEASSSLLHSFYGLAKWGVDALHRHINEVIYQGMIRSCIHPVLMDVELQKEAGDKFAVSYKSFLPLWCGLLDTAPHDEVPYETRTAVLTAVYDAFVSSFLKTVNKLDLSLERKNLFVSDPDLAMEARTVSDFQIFINCVDLFRDVVLQTSVTLLTKWLRPLLDEFIARCLESPLISGFYKVLATTLWVADEVEFFNDEPNSPELSLFLEGLVVKANQYTGDLQVACFEVILAAPVCIIQPWVDRIAPAVQVILRVGNGYPPLLDHLITALERWHRQLPPTTSRPLLTEVLPHFNVFLQSKSFLESDMEYAKAVPRTVKLRGKIQQRMFSTHSDSKLSVLQRRFMLFLRNVDSTVAAYLAQAHDTSSHTRVAGTLLYRMPLLDTKPLLNLSELLPRVIDLALSSSCRETRVTACELLHAMMLVALGQAAWKQEKDLPLRELLRTCLVLGCDADYLVQQLFQPLVLQTSHFFSSSLQRESTATAVFIEVLIEHVSHPFDPSVREFAAKVVKEFVMWSVKQSADAIRNIRPILQFVFTLSQHLSYNKRIGAALIFNNIYSILREEKAVLEVYWLQAYYHCLKSLSLYDKTEDTVQIVNAIEHCSRPLEERPDTFNTENPQRQVPLAFHGNRLVDLVVWTHSQCLSSHAVVRKEAKSLFDRLSKLVAGTTSPGAFLETFLPNHLEYYTARQWSHSSEGNMEVCAYYDQAFDYFAWVAKYTSVVTFVRPLVVEFTSEVATVSVGAKHTAIERFLDLLIAILHTDGQLIQHWFDDSRLLGVIAEALLRPTHLGFPTIHRQRMTHLRAMLGTLLTLLHSNLSLSQWKTLCTHAMLVHKLPKFPEVVKRKEVTTEEWDQLYGAAVCKELGLGVSVDAEQVFASLFGVRGRRPVALDLNPTVQTFLGKYLEFCSCSWILKKLLDNEEVVCEGTSQKITKGEYFLTYFKEPLFGVLVKNPEDFLEFIFERVSAKRLRCLLVFLEFLESCTIDKVHAVHVTVRAICDNWRETDSVEDSKLMRSVLAGMCRLSPGCLAGKDDLCKWLLKSLLLKTDNVVVLSLLPHMCRQHETDNNTVWIGLLMLLQAPWLSKQVLQGTPECQFLTLVLDALLEALSQTSSLVILRFSLKLMAKVEHLVQPEKVERALSAVVKSSNADHVNTCLKLLFEQCFNLYLDATARWFVCQYFLVPMLRIAEWDTTKCFILEHLAELHGIVTSKTGQTPSPAEVILDVTRKSCAVALVQAFYFQATSEELAKIKDSNPDAVQLLAGIFKECLYKVLVEFQDDASVVELSRRYSCLRFNTICTILSVKQKPALFKVIFKGGEKAYWHDLIDHSKKVEFALDFEEIPKKKKVLTTLRRTITAQQQQSMGQTVQSVKYLNTPTVFLSTLCDDVTKYDFTNCPIRSMESVKGLQEQRMGIDVELELDQVNSHECMATICAVVGQIEMENANESTPGWLDSILETLRWPRTTHNTRLFLLKLICNLSSYLEPYTEQVLAEVSRSVVYLLQEGPINHFILDLIVMMVSLPCFLTQDEVIIHQLTELVIKLIQKIDCPRIDMLKNNLEVVKTLVEVWKSNINMVEVAKHVFSRVHDESLSENSSANYISIHLTGILVANGVTPWPDEPSSPTFVKRILQLMRVGKKNHLAAETIGMILSHVDTQPNFAEIYQLVRDELRHYFCSDGKDDLSLLYYIYKFYPNITSDFVYKVRDCVWRNTFQLQGLEMLVSHVKRLEVLEYDGFSLTLGNFLKDMLQKSEYHELTLELVDALLGKVDDHVFDAMLEDIVRLSSSKVVCVRKSVCQVLCKMYVRNKWNVPCEPPLIEFISDSNADIAKEALRFWCCGRTPSATCARLKFIFKRLYTPSGFLTHCTYLMLEAAANSPDYKLSLYEQGLTSCNFEELKLLNSHRVRNVKLPPMFAQTLASQLSRPEEIFATLADTTEGSMRLRSTIQSLGFQPTVALQGEDDEATFVAGPSQSQSQADTLFKVPEPSRLRRRFLRSPQKASSYFAHRAMLKKKETLEAEKERVSKRDSKVTIYRTYRIGDFPDIQISHSHVLGPLKVLASKDSQLAKQFLFMLITGVVDYLKESQPDAADEFISGFGDSVTGFLETSHGVDPAVLSLLFHIALKYDGCFPLRSNSIRSLAGASGWLSTGALLVEHRIIRSRFETLNLVKRPRRDCQPGEEDWLNLAELYYELKDFNGLRGVMMDKLDSGDNVIKAIQAESARNWVDAAAQYKLVVNDEAHVSRTKLYSQSYLSCLAHMSDWKQILGVWCSDNTFQADFEKVWTESWYIERILPWLLKATMIERQNDFKQLVLSYLDETAKAVVLEERFHAELAVAQLLALKPQKANYYLDKFYLTFLEKWSHLDESSDSLKRNQLTQLQTMCELQSVLDVVAKRQMTEVDSLVEDWKKCQPAREHDLVVWDVKLALRKLLLKCLENVSGLELNHVKTAIALTELGVVRAAVEQGNLSLAQKYLSRLKGEVNSLEDSNVKTEFELCFFSGFVLKAQHSDNSMVEYVKVWRKMEQRLESHMDSEGSRAFLFRLQLSLAGLCHSLLPMYEETSVELVEYLAVPAAQLRQTMKQRCLTYYSNALKTGAYMNDVNKADVHFQMFKFCSKYGEDQDTVENLLCAISFGNSDARQLFGSALTLKTLTNLDKLVIESLRIPTWVFLLWINQLLAHMDTRNFPFVKSILERIADEYPNALRFPLKLNKGNESKWSYEVRNFVAFLTTKLSNPLHDRFCQAISYVTSPNHVLKYYLEKIVRLLKSENKTEAMTLLKQLLEVFYSPEDGVKLRGGAIKTTEKHKTSLEKLMEEDIDTWKMVVEKVLKAVTTAIEGEKLNERLRSYSPWLAAFQGSNLDELELPGQYDTDRKPILKYLTTINSFLPEILILPSKTKPFRVTILGNDALEYRFLVKFGEDLRQDQRIQQAFRQVNYTLGHQDRVLVYQVVPVTENLGLIQWVNDTKSLMDLIKVDATKVREARESHVKFLAGNSELQRSIAQIYAAGYMNIPRERAVAKYNARVAAFEWDLLRKAFWNMSSTPEQFSLLRANFTASQAIMYVTHWVIGIGDRHLQNTLVSVQSGKVLGIDFGYAFGFATQFLKPPELVPFRLTPQIMGLLQPLGEAGWIKQKMVTCLRTLRRDPAVIMAALELFALEPSLDWIEQAKKQERVSDDTEWYPLKKLGMVRRKLEGVNPLTIFSEDLHAGHQGNQVLTKYLEVLRGCKDLNKRAGMEEEGLTEEQQVECLLDLATDPWVLSYTYTGWDPWL